MKTKIKVLKEDMISPFQNMLYEIGKTYTAKDFNSDKKISCATGLYATDIDGVPYSWNIHQRAFEAEVWGKEVLYDQYKQRFENMKLIRELSVEELVARAKREEPRLGYKLSEVINPVHPLLLPPKEVTDREVLWLKKWDLV